MKLAPQNTAATVLGSLFFVLMCTPLVVCVTGDDEAAAQRARIDRYVQEEHQMFYINADPLPFVDDDPKHPQHSAAHVIWFCPPTASAEMNEEGTYATVVAHAVNFWFPTTTASVVVVGEEEEEAVDDQAANTTTTTGAAEGIVTPHGYVAHWSPTQAVYEEQNVDFDDQSFIWEGGVPGQTSYSGTVVAGVEGDWVFETNQTVLQQMLAALPIPELTGEACEDLYAEVWTSPQTSASTTITTSRSGRTIISQIVVATIASLFASQVVSYCF